MAYVGTPIDTINQFQSLVGKRFSGDASTTAFTLDVAPGSKKLQLKDRRIMVQENLNYQSKMLGVARK